jgi:N-acetylmuramoyl-L-alanine amidase
VPVNRVAHHAGNYNLQSIGIELVNLGRWPEWFHSEAQVMSEPYPQEQITALLHLLKYLQESHTGIRWITGHEDLDSSRIAASDAPGKLVKRKLDPGPEFPWQSVLAATGLARLEPGL